LTTTQRVFLYFYFFNVIASSKRNFFNRNIFLLNYVDFRIGKLINIITLLLALKLCFLYGLTLSCSHEMLLKS